MRKYIVAIYRMIPSQKWMVITINKEVDADFTSKNFNTSDCVNVATELKDMVVEIYMQNYLVEQFKNN